MVVCVDKTGREQATATIYPPGSVDDRRRALAERGDPSIVDDQVTEVTRCPMVTVAMAAS